MAIRISLQWPEQNDGLVYTDHVKGRIGCSLLQYYSSKHGTSATSAEWSQKILEGRIKMNGLVCTDPEALIP